MRKDICILTLLLICGYCCSQPRYRISDCGKGFNVVLASRNGSQPQSYYLGNDLYGDENLLLSKNQDVEIEEIKTNSEKLIEYSLYSKWESKSINDYLSKKQSSFSSLSMSHAGSPSNKISLQNIIPHNGNYVNRERRAALIVGNAHYSTNDSLLLAPIEALDVKDRLVDLGFDCFVLEDLTESLFEPVIKKFSEFVINEGYKVALFYYTGHGEEDKGGNDVLLPIDADTMGTKTVLVDDIVRLLQEKKEQDIRLLFLNACRNINPRYQKEGIRKTSLQDGTLLIQSTDQNKVADVTSNTPQGYSPFTVAFLDSLGEFDEDVSKTYDRIVRKVHQLAPDQQPKRNGHNVNFSFFRASTDSLKKWKLYLGTGGVLSIFPAVLPYANLGIVYKRWRFELGGALYANSKASDELYIYDSNENLLNGYKYKGEYRFFLKAGYDFPISDYWDFSILCGVSLNTIKGKSVIDNSLDSKGQYASAFSGTLDARFVWSPWKSRTFQFQGSVGFYGAPEFMKNSNFKTIEEKDKYIKKYATGVQFQLGVIWNILKW